MSYFFLGSEPVPWPFKLCGLFQAACDCVLGAQVWYFGKGAVAGQGVLSGKIG
jgi:solute carrier family 66, member 2